MHPDLAHAVADIVARRYEWHATFLPRKNVVDKYDSSELTNGNIGAIPSAKVKVKGKLRSELFLEVRARRAEREKAPKQDRYGQCD